MLEVDSVFRWNDAVEEAAEWMLVCKIRADDYPLVEAAIRSGHGYDVPEILATPVAAGFPPYLTWIEASTRR